ncbi:MAG TPA: amino acid adenylation domain-containing protein [Candidatus Angelobacter sp.]
MLKQAVEGYRISPLQRRMWLLQSADRGVTYGTNCAVQIEGELDRDRLRNAIASVVARHEVLRTTFPTLPGTSIPVQVVEESRVEVECAVQTVDGLDPSSYLCTNGLHRVTQEGPVLQCKLFRCGPHKHLLLLRISSLCADATSMVLFVEKLSYAYLSNRTTQDGGLPEGLQYPDVAEWLNKIGESEASEVGRRFWMDQTSAIVDSLPRQGHDSASAGAALESLAIDLPAGTISVILAGDRDGRWKDSAFLLASWATLLARFGYEAPCIAISCDCRSHEMLRNAIGPLTRHVPVIVPYSRHVRFSDLSVRASAATKEAKEWQEYFNWEDIEKGKSSAQDLLYFPFSFEYLEMKEPASSPGELQFAIKALNSHTDRIGIHLSCRRFVNDLQCELHWDAHLHAREDVSRLAKNLPALLEDAVHSHDLPLGQLKIITDLERKTILEQFNPPQALFPESLVHELFEQQAARTPTATAVRFKQSSLTYQELNELSSRVAACLADRRVKPETLVGICFDRSLELVAAILGILKAGGGYVPLDPDYPLDRLRFMVRDSKVEIIITTSAIASKLEGCRAKRVLMNELNGMSARRPSPPLTLADNPAYVLYTSGSTGQPKGVVISHRALRNHMVWMLREFSFAGERVLQKTAFSFDASVWEFFAPLLTGGCLVMARPGAQRDAEYLVQCIRDEQITVLQLVPSQLQMLLQDSQFDQCSSLNLVFSGGEALSMELVKQFYARFPEARLFNLYGPTESTIDATLAECNVMDKTLIASIGAPIANFQVYILDEGYELAPVGVKGELYIAGAGLARGYLNRPDLTADRFVPHPFSAQSGARLYQTGDLARWRADGTLEYLGRQDDQVKVRGYRIELGEIEAVLNQYTAVEQAVVVLREVKIGEQRLIAYVVRRDRSEPLDARDVREYLKERLPDYMLPSAFVELDALPLSPNGKVTRRALPLPEEDQKSASCSDGPKTAIEELVAGIWQQVLKTDKVTREASFFELGGHSLLATQVIARVRNVFGVEAPLRTLFEAPTLAEFAVEIERLRSGGIKDKVLPLEPVSRNRELPLSYAQQRIWFMEQLSPGGPLYTIPLQLRMKGELDHQALQRSFNEMVRRHEVLRTKFPVRDDGPVQEIASHLQLNIEKLDLSGLAEGDHLRQAEKELDAEISQGFDLATGPLVRVKLLKLDQQDHMLMVTMHHIVSDGWSLGIMANEVGRLYEAYLKNERADSALPPLRVQYADYSVWQRQWLEGRMLEDQLTYWRKQLVGAPPVLNLATDRLRPAMATYRGAREFVVIHEGLTASLKELGRSSGTTLFMTLLAGYQLLLSRYSGQDDVVVGTTIAGRRHTETEPLIGIFVNMLALRTDLSDDPEFRELLIQVREETLGAYAHQDLPFERLVADLQLERSLVHSPVFQAIFELHNVPEEDIPLSGLQMERMELGPNVAKFDLRLSLTEGSGELNGMIEYSADLFDPGTIKRLIKSYVVLLQAAVANPACRLSELSILTAVECRQILVEWNFNPMPRPQDVCIHELFEIQAQRNPANPAIDYETQQVTFEELNAQANRLGHYLRNLGLGPEARVGICLRRSPEMVVALLGALKAGGAYVPMDPAFPVERLHYMMEDAQISVLITQASLRDRLPVTWAQVVTIDADWKEVAECADANLKNVITSRNLAYILYTSGSTGHPKGVSIEHRSLVNYIEWARQVYGEQLNAFDLPLYSSIAFDLTLTSIFMPLLSGGCMRVYGGEDPEAVDLVARVLREDKSATVKLTPSHLTVIDAIMNRNLKQLVVGGELLENRLARRIIESASAPLTIWNEYGPTEATVGCMLYRYDPAAEQGSTVPIGKPAGNTQIYVLDRNLTPVPIGAPGEIYIGGTGLARGYLNKPDLTAERFIPNPLSPVPGERLYHTGDRARHNLDGNLEFLGRLDDQVKVRGFRIELGEIEAALAAHPGVTQTAVVVREDISEDKRLVAYAVMVEAPDKPGPKQLQEYLRTRMPEYMVPSSIVELAELPLTPNGKLDRRALPKPGHVEADTTTLPLTELELKLTLIWEDVLNIPSFISRNQSFFDLGGHSLLAITLMARIKEQFGQELPLSVLFEGPTIEHLASVLRGKYHPNGRSNLLPIHRHGSKRPVFFVHPLGGNGLNYILLARLLGEDQPFYSFQALDEEDAARPTVLSVEDRASLYIASMREIQPEGPYLIGGWSWGGYVAFEIARQLHAQGLGVAALFLLDISALIENELSDNSDDAEFLLTHIQSNRLRFADEVGGLEQQMLELSLAAAQDCSPEERLQYLIDELIKIKLLRPEVEITQVRNYIHGCLGRAQSLLDYKIREYPGAITLLRTPGNFLPHEDADGPHDEKLGWGEFSPDVQVHLVSGNHFNMVFPPHIETVAEVLSKCMAELTVSAKAAGGHQT